jgi:hypothetical protein
MIILRLCVDQERGKYLALFADYPEKRALSNKSTAEAVAFLIMKYPTDVKTNPIVYEVDWMQDKFGINV